MELKDFISNTIYDICMGINEAKEKVWTELNNQPISPGKMGGEDIKLYDNKIDFDLSVTASSEDTNNKKVGIIKVIEAGIGKTSKSSQEAVNRITFSVPFFPQAISKKDKDD